MLRTLITTAISLVAFAANSLLARAALADGSIDPLSFTAARLVSGAIALALVVALLMRRGQSAQSGGSWPSALALFVYAVAFSWAYLSLSAGTGALVLFGAVQATMIAAGLAGGERPRPLRWLGLLAALFGLVYLVSPGLSAPDPLGAFTMAAAGVAWGVYSLRGRSDVDPILATAGNFARSVPFALAVLTLGFTALVQFEITPRGLLLATISGVVTSGLGYVVWYFALAGLSATLAAVVQLAVPLLAALGGVVLLGESFTYRLALASALILGGIAIASPTGDRR